MAKQVEDADFELLNKVKMLNLGGDEIVSRVRRADDLERLAKVGAAARAAGLHGDALAPLLLSFELEVEMRPIRVQSGTTTETREVPFVRARSDAAGTGQPLRAFVEKAGTVLHQYASSLIAGPAPADAPSPAAASSSAAAAVDKVLSGRAERAKQTNPLLPGGSK
jgi:hypothetical protein